MKKLIISLSAACMALSCSIFAHAQGEMDVYRTTRKSEIGTARFQAMGGAFTALGGDLSAISINPAAAGVFHRGEFALSLNLNSSNAVSPGFTPRTTYRWGTPQLGVVFSFFKPSRGSGFTFAFNRNTVYQYDRSFLTPFQPAEEGAYAYSIADYMALLVPNNVSRNELNFDNPNAPFLPTLGLKADLIAPTHGDYGPFESIFYYPTGEGGKYELRGPESSMLSMRERGAMVDYDFTFGANYQDLVYAGLSFKYSSMYYKMSSSYDEKFLYGDYISLENNLLTKGDGFSIGIGIIGRPVDGLRLGFSLYSPTFLSLEDNFSASIRSRYSQGLDNNGNLLPPNKWVTTAQTPDNAYYRYRITAPLRANFGIAGVLGSEGLVSLDYEFTATNAMRAAAHEDWVNSSIAAHFKPTHTLRFGAEYKPISRLALRVGAVYASSPIKDPDMASKKLGQAKTTVTTVGTTTQYEIPGSRFSLSGGMGLRLTSSFYVDAALTYHRTASKVYPFATDKIGGREVLSPVGQRLQTSGLTGSLTLGLKF